jgi:hypothetical protein
VIYIVVRMLGGLELTAALFMLACLIKTKVKKKK